VNTYDPADRIVYVHLAGVSDRYDIAVVSDSPTPRAGHGRDQLTPHPPRVIAGRDRSRASLAPAD